jgi:dihydrofolate reductase
LCLVVDSYPGLITWVIGGANVIEQSLEVIDEFYISRIPGDYECDTFLPLDEIVEDFELSFTEEHPEVTFEIWKKKL